jgi:hypothetical protein
MESLSETVVGLLPWHPASMAKQMTAADSMILCMNNGMIFKINYLEGKLNGF